MLDLNAAYNWNFGAVAFVIVGKVVRVVNNTYHESARWAMGNLLAVPQLIFSDLEHITARTLIGEGRELFVPYHVFNFDFIVNCLWNEHGIRGDFRNKKRLDISGMELECPHRSLLAVKPYLPYCLLHAQDGTLW